MESSKVHDEPIPVESDMPTMEKSATTQDMKKEHDIIPVESEELRREHEMIPVESDMPTMEKSATTQEMRRREQQPEEEKPSSCVAASVTQIILRMLTGASMLAAVILLLFTEQTTNIGGYSLHASYKSSPTFKFFFIGTAVTGGYALVSIPFAFCCHRSSFLHFLDLMAMALAMAAASAATAVGYIGKFGNEEIGWFEVCNNFERFCGRVAICVGCCYIGFLSLLIICALSSCSKAR